MDTSQTILYHKQGGKAKIEVRLANETAWLIADQIAESFQRSKSSISRHIKNIYESGELELKRTVAFFHKYKPKEPYGMLKYENEYRTRHKY